MTGKDILKLLEKHEESCDKRYGEINDKLKRLDNRLWMIVTLIVVASGLEQLI
jgi:hypothetical protein